MKEWQPDMFVNQIHRSHFEHLEWICWCGDGIVVMTGLHACFSGPVETGNGGEELSNGLYNLLSRLEFARRRCRRGAGRQAALAFPQ